MAELDRLSTRGIPVDIVFEQWVGVLGVVEGRQRKSLLEGGMLPWLYSLSATLRVRGDQLTNRESLYWPAAGSPGPPSEFCGNGILCPVAVDLMLAALTPQIHRGYQSTPRSF